VIGRRAPVSGVRRDANRPLAEVARSSATPIGCSPAVGGRGLASGIRWASFLALTLVVLLPCGAFAQERCAVIMESAKGGSVHIDAGVMPPGAPPAGETFVGWRPPSRGDRIALSLAFGRDAPSKLGDPVSGMAMFRLVGDAPPRDVKFVIKANGKDWSLPAQSGDYMPGRTVHDFRAWAFLNDKTAPGLLQALWSAKTASASVLSDGMVVAKASFDMHDLGARDILLSRARADIASPDSQHCSATNSAAPTSMQYLCLDSKGIDCPVAASPSSVLSIRPVG